MNKIKKFATHSALFLAMIPAMIKGQTTGNITGQVTNENNNGLKTKITYQQEQPINSNNYKTIKIDSTNNTGFYNTHLDSIITNIFNENTELPKTFALKNYPNPFNPTTQIATQIPKSGNYKLTIYQIDAQKITELNNLHLTTGTYEFNAKNLGAAGVKIAVLQGTTNDGHKIYKAWKMMQLDGNHGTPTITRTGQTNTTLKKTNYTNSEEIRLRMIYEYLGNETPGYKDTTITKTYQSNNVNDNIDVILKKTQYNIDFQFGWWSVHGLTRKGKTIHFQDLDNPNQTYDFVCNQNNKVHVQMLLPEGHSGMFKIYQDDPLDSLMETSMFENKNSGETIAVTEQDRPNYQVLPWIITNIHKLDSAATADELGYFDVPRYAQTNNYPRNGVPGYIDLKNPNWSSMFIPRNGFNYRWEKTHGLDSIYVIGSPIDQGNNPQELSEETLTEYRQSVQQIINLANQLPNGAWTNIPFTQMKEFDDPNNNPLVDSLRTYHGAYNSFRVFFGDGDNGGFSKDSERRIQTAFAHFNPPSQMTTMISEMGIVAALDDPPSPPVFARVGEIWQAINVPGYNGSELTEAAYLMFHFRQKTPKDYIFPR